MTIFSDNRIIENVYDDIGYEDITTNSLIPENKWAQAEILCKEDGILAGMDVAHYIINEFGLNISSSFLDGEDIHKGDVILEFEGKAKDILMVERSILNYLMHLSGIATLVKNTCDRVKEVNPNVKVACTRKTTPGLQKLEKKAVEIGGGDTHRFKLDDCVLIKDNHIQVVGGVIESIELAKENVSFTKKIEIEVESEEDAVRASMFGADIVMLDNMTPKEISSVLNTLKERRLREDVIIEVSGGINPENILNYAELDVDVISSGFITNSAKSLDLSLNII
ncbi:MAG: carboxylating nicotinate-nucleotide diphosphorylase [Methanosphaera sp.]|uniref:carboxylating nicotinate-nucleotide diphosphorylase n=1 Tax=Methanosphaera sp. TaxID=2666342 RepID=UPI002E7868FB|nr:carboxylating nicotinate-nucleotide diphosphorylase [Methanosphaera sp.]MEE1116984.1 carboxylating nicotinate-nucleotide diphosphorylase [Methanosphaera sp.]MEE3324374.1 carboxylating nicotinate-nucleotide diphosphorylase [Methanosphaera sp.]MEE3419007.1 carboxylating nicotinate-nucleotide diphosphorylase [Methanosphaera sp.]